MKVQRIYFHRIGSPGMEDTLDIPLGDDPKRHVADTLIHRVLVVEQESRAGSAENEPPKQEREAFEARAERMEDALHKIKQWAEAYPVDIFHVPTSDEWKRLHEAAQAAGLNGIDAFSAANMRHVITQVQAIVDAALGSGGEWERAKESGGSEK